MIQDINELVAYTEMLGDESPIIRDQVVIRRPGSPPDVIAAIAGALPGLPPGYFDVARRIDLVGAEIGYFRLSPGSGFGLLDQLVSSNTQSETPMARYFQRDGVYQVAAWEADPIGIAFRPSRFAVGELVKYNIGNPPQAPVLLAGGYEQLLLLAVNLDAVRQKFSDPDEDRPLDADEAKMALSEFDSCLKALSADRYLQIQPAWQVIAEVVFS
jgi:hypothetical protein